MPIKAETNFRWVNSLLGNGDSQDFILPEIEKRLNFKPKIEKNLAPMIGRNAEQDHK